MINSSRAFSLLSLLLACPYVAMAATPVSQSMDQSASSITSSWHIFDNAWEPRATVWGYAGDHLLGQADAMVPLIGSDTGMFYADINGNAMNNRGWLAGLGGGYRQIVANSAILGINGFIQREYSQYQTGYWVANPGIEAIWPHWDLHLNGYFPFSQKRHYLETGFADNYGNYQYVAFAGHDQYDHVFSVFDQVGSGVDAEIGVIPPGELNKFHAYVGGYLFAPRDTKKVKGVSGKLVYNISHNVALQATDTYDNLFNNTALVGIKISFGGMPEDTDPTADISNRMLDPVEHNLTTYSGSASIPAVRVLKDEGKAVEKTEIYFFTGNGNNPYDPAKGVQNCTYEHPCTLNGSFNQATINSIDSYAPNTNYYFNATPSGYNINNGIVLPNGVSIFGRNSNYTTPAMDNGRPLFLGNIGLTGNNTLDSLQLMNSETGSTTQTTESRPGIYITGNNVSLNNDLIGGAGSQAYQNPIYMVNATNATISNSTINARFMGDDAANVIGILMNNSYATLNNSVVNASQSVLGTTVNGIKLDNHSFLQVNGSFITAAQQGLNMNVNGILANDSSIVSLNNSIVNATYRSDNGESLQNFTTAIDGIQLNSSSQANITNGSIINAGYSEGQNTRYQDENVSVNGIASNNSRVDIDTEGGRPSSVNASYIGANTTSYESNTDFAINSITAANSFINLGNGNTADFTNTINSTYNGFGSAAVSGINASNSTVIVTKKSIRASNIDNNDAEGIASKAFGIHATGNSSIMANNANVTSAVNVTKTPGSTGSISAISVGILGENATNITVNGGVINSTASSNAVGFNGNVDVLSTGIGIGSLSPLSIGSGSINVQNARVSATANSTAGANASGTTTAFGIGAISNGTVTVKNSFISATAIANGPTTSESDTRAFDLASLLGSNINQSGNSFLFSTGQSTTPASSTSSGAIFSVLRQLGWHYAK